MKLVIVPLALAELNDAAAFYKARANAALGLALVAEFERATSLVLANPFLGAVFRGTRHRFFLRRFHTASFIRSPLKTCASLQLRIIGGVRVTGQIASSCLCSIASQAAQLFVPADLGKDMRGKHFEEFKKGSNLVLLTPELSKIFPTNEAVNAALSSLVGVAHSATGITSRPSGRATKRRAA